MHDFYDYPANQGFVDEKYIRAKVESAGRTIMMLPSSGVWPAGYRSCLPDYVYEFSDLIEAPKGNAIIPMRPSRIQMNEMEEVQEWLIELSKHCTRRKIPHVARLTAIAMLHYPRSGRRVYSFRKLGHQFGTSHTGVRNWYKDGIRIMQSGVNGKKGWHADDLAAFTAP